jgi:hypothetical protein
MLRQESHSQSGASASSATLAGSPVRPFDVTGRTDRAYRHDLRDAAFRLSRIVGLLAVGGSLAASLFLLLQYRELGGPDDPVDYYRQAARLIPFDDHFFGPGYFVTLRALHDLTRLDWFTTGKLLSWLSACAVLLLSFRFFKTLLPGFAAWLCLALVAWNPAFIGESYSALTTMFGAAVLLAAVVMTLRARPEETAHWLGAGVAFGLAYLTRFQALGFLGGAVLGTLFIRAAWRRRALAAAGLLLGAALPIAAWYAFLLGVQGYTPANHNFVNLTHALGRFHTFGEVPELVREYGSLRGVLTSEPLAIPKILLYAVREAVAFPFSVAFPLLFLAAGFILPGGLLLLLQRRVWTPWLCAFLLGFFLTGIGAWRWIHYYIALLPFLILMVAQAVAAVEAYRPNLAGRIAWLLLLTSTLGYAALRVPAEFHRRYWPEVTVAREWLQRNAPDAVVAATAGSLRHRTSFPFVYVESLVTPDSWDRLVDRLRRAGVTHVVVTERHGVDVLPQLNNLLRDDTRDIPPGLRRDTLIVQPRRLAILQVTASAP